MRVRVGRVKVHLFPFVLRLLFRIYVDQCNKLNGKRLARMDRSREGTVNLTLGSPPSPLAADGMAAKFRSLFNSLEIYPLPRPPSKGTFGPSSPPLKRLWRRISALALSLSLSLSRSLASCFGGDGLCHLFMRAHSPVAHTHRTQAKPRHAAMDASPSPSGAASAAPPSLPPDEWNDVSSTSVQPSSRPRFLCDVGEDGDEID